MTIKESKKSLKPIRALQLDRELGPYIKQALEHTRNVQESPPAFDQWWDSCYRFNAVESEKRLAEDAWLAAIKYAEYNIGLDRR